MTKRQTAYLALVGPTCVGKTSYSHAVLAEFPFELINLDSFQVFDFFRLGTGRADLNTERAHLYGVQDPTVILPSAEYVTRADIAIQTIVTNGRIPLFEGGSISYLHALRAKHSLRLIGLRPRNKAHARQLIEQRLTKNSEERLLAEISEGVKLGYGNSIILQDDVVYLPYVRYLAGEVSLIETRRRVRENLLRRYATQIREYENFPVEWFEPSIESLAAIRNIAASFVRHSKESV
jgi:tRNA A37 N6-isopentenylltransferase MiaA